MRAKLIINPAATSVAPRFTHSASFRRFAGPMTGEEALLAERFERQRHALGRVRAYVADPERKFTRLISRYIEWLQLFIRPDTDCLMCAPLTPDLDSELHQIPSVWFNTARSPHRWHGAGLAVNQCVILDADRLSPSLPYRLSKLDRVNRDFIGSLSQRNTVLIIIGDPYRRRRNRYRHLWHRVSQQAQDAAKDTAVEAPAIDLLDPADPASAMAPKILRPPSRSINLCRASGACAAEKESGRAVLAPPSEASVAKIA